jgi:ABC-type molybdate transport system substrate-binding protein
MNSVRRRIMLTASALIPLAMALEAKADTTDLAVICDLTLGVPLRSAGAAFRAGTGVRIQVFPTAPGLITLQLSREVQIDIVVAQGDVLDQATQAGLLAASPRSGAWRNALVVAEMIDASGAPDAGKFAVSELAAASGIDGTAVVARLGIDSARVVSAIDTTEVAFLLTTGGARTGVLRLTEVRADPRLRVVRTVAEPAPARCAAAITEGARRPNPAAFISFLSTEPAQRLLATAGLEIVA